MLYGVYALMAAGYAADGDGATAACRRACRPSAPVATCSPSARMGLSIYIVMCIAGRMHCGRPLDESHWVPAGAMLIIVAALLRAIFHIYPAAAALPWMLGFAIAAWRLAPLWLAPREDGGADCEGLLRK
jgi:uncharacterized protein involved in response to NO